MEKETSGKVWVASLQAFPPSGRLCVKVAGRLIALFRVGAQVYASDDACPHEGVSLSKGGTLQGEEITCGYHFWCFNVRTGESVDGMSDPLRRYAVQLVGDDVYLLAG